MRRHSNKGTPLLDPDDEQRQQQERKQQQQQPEERQRTEERSARKTMLINSMENHNILLKAAGEATSVNEKRREIRGRWKTLLGRAETEHEWELGVLRASKQKQKQAWSGKSGREEGINERKAGSERDCCKCWPPCSAVSATDAAAAAEKK